MKYLILLTLLFTNCSNKSQILGGKICGECGRDNPSWRKNFCPTCKNYDDLDYEVRWNKYYYIAMDEDNYLTRDNFYSIIIK
jgi:predicted amidophosphoribosyltransferase